MPIEVEEKRGLTCHDVSREMEFRNEKVERFATGIGLHPMWIQLHPLPEVNAPLASNVV
jgi:hypothetical protein